jgi:SAM-dependent methyltransferase
MTERQIRFEDGASYERMMGVWSRSAGQIFLDWLAPKPALAWVDVGCGNGAFTELLVERCAPAAIEGIDPSPAQLAFARQRPAARLARFREGDAMALPFADRTFDAAVMALVIFFVPEPARGVAEMVRVVRPGGSVSAYAWDALGGGLPFEPIQVEMRAMGMTPLMPPRPEASGLEAMRALWEGAGLVEVETREIGVTRIYPDFDDFWTTSFGSANLASALKTIPVADVARLKERLRAGLPTDASGRITCAGRANAVKGRVPAQAGL